MCFCKPSAPQEAEMDRGTDHRVITEIIFSYVLQHTEHGFKISHLTSDLKSHLPLFQFDPRVCPIFKHSQEREKEYSSSSSMTCSCIMFVKPK